MLCHFEGETSLLERPRSIHADVQSNMLVVLVYLGYEEVLAGEKESVAPLH